MSVMKPETWDEVLAGHSPDVAAAARTIQGIIVEELPESVVYFDRGNGLLAFGRSSSMRDLLFALIPHAGWLNLQLADGAVLPDPDGLIEGTGKRIRHVKIHSVEAATSAPVVAIVEAQLAARPED